MMSMFINIIQHYGLPQKEFNECIVISLLFLVSYHKCLQDHKVEQISERSGAKSRNKGLTATPAWTSLAVRKQDVSFESARQAKINRHGGNSSAVSRNRHERRQKAPPLEKAPDGRRRAS